MEYANTSIRCQIVDLRSSMPRFTNHCHDPAIRNKPRKHIVLDLTRDPAFFFSILAYKIDFPVISEHALINDALSIGRE